jgi:hypothetical protein
MKHATDVQKQQIVADNATGWPLNFSSAVRSGSKQTKGGLSR